MITAIELQIISKILTSQDTEEVERLCEFDESYYSVFSEQIKFILDHKEKYGDVPDPFTFQAQFSDITLVQVRETTEYLIHEIKRNKKHILLLDTFNTLKKLGTSDVDDAWKYIEMQTEKATALDSTQPMNIVKEAEERSRQVQEYSKRSRIPTGFEQIDELMYGGLSTVEELVIILARTNTGKSWVGTKMMESAQKNGFPVLYYSPEMQACLLATRFDTWRGHYQNSQLHRGNYTDQYMDYIKSLKTEDTDAFILEDKDCPDNEVNVPALRRLVRKNKIKLLIIDGLSYMEDYRARKGDTDSIKFKNLCQDLFRVSKQLSCAVVIMMQANRESKNNKDDKGNVFPDIYNIEGSDHPGRIATQVFALRQIFDKHVLDIRLEKSRNANNQKPEFSYAWDINTGNMQYLPNAEANVSETVTPVINPGLDTSASTAVQDIVLDDLDDDVEF